MASKLAEAMTPPGATGSRPLYVLSLTVGLRRGEALGLRWSDVDLAAKSLRVSRQLQRMRGGGLVFSEPTNARRRTVDLPRGP